MSDILNLVKNLCLYETEREWFEFKVNWFEPVQFGEYISAISNSAALEGRECGYFILGIDDLSHDIAGTNFSPDMNVKGEPLKHFLARQISKIWSF